MDTGQEIEEEEKESKIRDYTCDLRIQSTSLLEVYPTYLKDIKIFITIENLKVTMLRIFPYVILSHVAPSSFLSFICFWKISISSFLLLFKSL